MQDFVEQAINEGRKAVHEKPSPLMTEHECRAALLWAESQWREELIQARTARDQAEEFGRKSERERCARIAEEESQKWDTISGSYECALEIAAKIREAAK